MRLNFNNLSILLFSLQGHSHKQKMKWILTKEFQILWTHHGLWRHRTGSILAQVMACCLTAPSHYLNQCCLISKVQRHSFVDIIVKTDDTNRCNKLENYYHWDYYEGTHLKHIQTKQNGYHFADDIFKWIFCNINIQKSDKISQRFGYKGPNDNTIKPLI